MEKIKHKVMLITYALLVAFLDVSLTFAQGRGGLAGIQKATNEVASYFNLLTKLMYLVGVVCGLMEAVRVCNKFQSGDQDTGKNAASWFGAYIFLFVSVTILKSFFIGG